MTKLKFNFKVVMGALLSILIALVILYATKIIPTSIATENIEPKIEVALEKYINYNNSEQDKGTLVQYRIRTGMEYKDEEYAPISQSELNIDIDKIDNSYPTKVNVITKSTQATNGNKKDQVNYAYDNTTGRLQIIASNQDNAYTSGNKDEKDDYLIICYYNTYTKEKTERVAKLNISEKYILQGEERTEVSKNGTFSQTVKDEYGELTSITTETDEIYNGYIKSNIINGTDYGTKFKEVNEIIVSNKDAQEEIVIKENTTLVKIENNGETDVITQELGNNGNVVYRTAKISQENMKKVLGEDGSINIQDNKGTVLAEINKDTEAEDGMYKIIYAKDPESLVIKTSKVVNEGIIKIEHEKEIKSTMRETSNIGIKTTNEIEGIKQNISTKNGTETKTDETTYKYENKRLHNIKNSETNIEAKIDNEEWTNEKQNEVKINAILKSNSPKYNLFNNPIVKIKLPEQVEKVVLGDNTLIYGNGLELEDVWTETDETGKISIIAKMRGAQTQYHENILGIETELNINASIILKKELENTTSKVNIICENEGQVITKEREIKIIDFKEESAQQEIEEKNDVFLKAEANQKNISVLTSQLATNLKLDVVPTKGENVLKDNDVIYEGEYIKYNIKVTNNSTEKIDNVKVIAQIPEGMTYGELVVDEFTNLGKYEYNFDEELREKTIQIGTIEAGSTSIAYYEVKVNDLSDGENSKEINTNITSYVGDAKSEEYKITNNIQKSNEKAFMGAFYYTGKLDYFLNIYSNEEKEVDVNIKIPKGLKLHNICKKDNIMEKVEETRDGAEYVYIKTDYLDIEEINVNITNNVLTTKLATNNSYIFDFQIDETDIEKENGKSEKELTSFAEIDNKYLTNECRIKLSYNNIKTTMTSEKEGEDLKYGDEVVYNINIENIGGQKRGELSEENEYIKVNLEDILPENMDGQTITYNNYEITYKDNDGVEYIDGFNEVNGITQSIAGKIYNTENGEKLPDIDMDLIIPTGKSINISVKATAGYVDQKTDVENNATISGEILPTLTTNTIKNTILAYKNEENSNNNNNNQNNSNNQNSNNNNNSNNGNNSNQNSNNSQNNNNQNNSNQNSNNTTQESQYTISGLVWNDENRDGQRQSNEELLSGITAMLVDMNNSGRIANTTQTASNGTYEFKGIEQGNYLVIFRYDTNKYRVTSYQQSQADSSENSDVISQKIVINGSEEIVAITDEINVNRNIPSIDMGLIENQLCDFKIDKYISKITVKTSKGTKETTYDNVNFAKTEIRAKEIENAIVAIEYKLVITNVGEASGKVGQIVDILPTGFEFSSDINNGWTRQKGTTVVNKNLASTNIKAGESVEIPLIVTKKMTANGTGTFTNVANIQGVESIENAGDLNEGNNTSKADVIISISTGTVLYITGVIIALIILVIISSIILNKNGKINIKNMMNYSKFTALIILLVAFTFILNNKFTTNSLAAIKGSSGSIPSFTIKCLGESVNIKGEKSSLQYITNNESKLQKATFEYYGYPYIVEFRGGPTGKGLCENASLKAAGWNGEYNENCETWPVTYRAVGFYGSPKVTDDSAKGAASLDYTLEKIDSQKTSAVEGDYCKFGPFKFNYQNKDDSNPNYTVIVTLGNGREVTPQVEPALSGEGNKEFYIKLRKEECKDGISKVTLKSNAKVKQTINTTVSGKIEYYYSSSNQTLVTDKPVTVSKLKTEWSPEKEKTIDWTDELPGIIEVEKRDKDNNSIKLEEVTITVDGTSKQTDKNGRVTFENLKIGSKQIAEVEIPNYGYTVLVNATQELISGQYVLYEMDNEKQVGTLILEKKDKDSGKPMEGVKFKIMKGNSYIKINGTDTVIGSVSVNDGKWEDVFELVDVNSATTFITDSNGQIKIENILVSDWEGDYKSELKGMYGIKETDIGGNYGYTEFEISENVDGNYVYINDSPIGGDKQPEQTEIQNLERLKESTINIFNRRKYIKLSGNVWEDGLAGKDNSNNNEFDSDDINLAGIKVTLKRQDGSVVTNPDSKAFVNPAVTDENGHYYFEDVLIDELDQYYIEFEYNGEIYTTVKSFDELGESKSSTNTSKVQEIDSQRDDLDNSYAEIKGNGNKAQSNVNGTKGQFAVNYELTQNGENDATAKTKNIEKFEGQLSGTTRNVNEFNGYENYDSIDKISATTQETGFGTLGDESADSIRKNEIKEIGSINCGLIQREQADISVSTDLESVVVSVNGYTNTYKYGNRKNEEFQGDVLDSNGNKVGGPEDKFRLDVKREKWGYLRPMYASDIIYNGTDTCRVFMTYSITVRNNSNSVKAKVLELLNYRDARYTRVSGENWSEDDKGTYKVEHINSFADKEIPAGSSETIEVTYQLSNEAVLSILSGNISLNNTIEISSYCTYYGDETYYHTGGRNGLYASIDKDSAPNNIEFDNQSTYEDDTMKAPGITMMLYTSERTLSGNVFEDMPVNLSGTPTSHEVYTNQERKGNGVFDTEGENADNTIEKVIVEVYKFNPQKQPAEDSNSIWTDSSGELASVWRQTVDSKYIGTATNGNGNGYKIDAKLETNKDGYYSFEGLVPGEYVIKFTYGNGNVFYKNGAEVKRIDENANYFKNADYFKSTVINSSEIRTELEKNPKVPSMWYKTTETIGRYSDAADDKEAYEFSTKEKTMNKEEKHIIEHKSAYTAPLNIKLEQIADTNGNVDTSDPTSKNTISQYTKTNSDGTQQVENIIQHYTTNVDFGIIEKAKLDYDIVKEIENVKITLSNGQVLIDGNPKTQNLQYVKFLPNTPFNRANTINMEIDNELIVGATLEISYKVVAKNLSELSYVSYDYYYFGEPKGNKETIEVSQILDYFDNELVFENSDRQKYKIDSIDGSTWSEANKYLANDDIINIAKKYNNLLILRGDSNRIAPNETQEWKYKGHKVLTTAVELEYINNVEGIEVKTTMAPPIVNEFGNHDPENPNTPDETDFYSEQVVITSPTGGNKSNTNYIIGAVALVVLAGVIIVIKRKVM